MTVIAVAISGGVDSLVAAFLLKQAGHDVVGLHFRTGFENGAAGAHGPAPRPSAIAALARQVGIPLEVLDLSQAFRETVVAYFTAAYQAGRTPNPCLFCNPTIKFGHLLSHAREGGAQGLATGHYARVREDPDGRRHLLRGVDSQKDQSYFLSRLSPDQLQCAHFPLGGLTKNEVRRIARDNRLAPAVRSESQDICFIRGMSYHAFLQGQKGFQPREGVIEDTRGRVLGRHQGLHLFTIGQRRGINCPAAEPYYVVGLDHHRNRLIVGQREELARTSCGVKDVNWIHRPALWPADVTAQIRYRHRGAAAKLEETATGTVAVTFATPQNAITPGQGAVFYQGNEVLGGGWIDEHASEGVQAGG
jgi:tRNA-specific 2-thiouridylase